MSRTPDNTASLTNVSWIHEEQEQRDGQDRGGSQAGYLIRQPQADPQPLPSVKP